MQGSGIGTATGHKCNQHRSCYRTSNRYRHSSGLSHRNRTPNRYRYSSGLSHRNRTPNRYRYSSGLSHRNGA